jgi:hypothetical protein
MFDNEFTDLQESIGDGLFEEEFDFEEENGYYNMENQETEFDYEEDADPFLGGVVSGIARAASGPMGGMLKNMAQRAPLKPDERWRTGWRAHGPIYCEALPARSGDGWR